MAKERLVSSDDAVVVIGLAVITILLILVGSWVTMTT